MMLALTILVYVSTIPLALVLLNLCVYIDALAKRAKAHTEIDRSQAGKTSLRPTK